MFRNSLFKHRYQADLEALSTPGGFDEKRTGIQERYKQICNILSIGRVGRGLAPPDKINNINILLRHNTLVLVLDRSHRTCAYLLSVLFYFWWAMIAALLLHRNYTLQTASAFRTVGVGSIFACSHFAPSFILPISKIQKKSKYFYFIPMEKHIYFARFDLLWCWNFVEKLSAKWN